MDFFFFFAPPISSTSNNGPSGEACKKKRAEKKKNNNNEPEQERHIETQNVCIITPPPSLFLCVSLFLSRSWLSATTIDIIMTFAPIIALRTFAQQHDLNQFISIYYLPTCLPSSI